MSKNQLKITPVSSANNQEILKNIKTNMEIIETWLSKKSFNDQEVYICSGGPSLDKFLRENKEKVENSVTFCVKHALPKFKKYGLVPTFCNALDPRPIENISTLGEKRIGLYEQADKQTTFFIASMCHPSVTQWLLDNGFKVVGYHTATSELSLLDDKDKEKIGNFIITGGTNSAFRAMEIAFSLGFTKQNLVGFDASFDGPRPTDIVDGKGKQLYMKVTVNDKPFYTTGELIAQTQDIESLISNSKCPFEANFVEGLETSLANAIVEARGNKTLRSGDWRHYLAQ